MKQDRFQQRCRSRLGLSLLIMLVTLLISTCGQPPAPPAQGDAAAQPQLAGADTTAQTSAAPKHGGKLTMSLADGDILSWDPITTGDNMSIWTTLLIYDQLVRATPDGRGVEPALAERYEISADGKTYTFAMRQGVQFHDGTPLRIEDLQYAIERGTSTESVWRWVVPPIVRMTTANNTTLVVELAEPWPPFLADLALVAFSVIPKQLHQQQGAAFFDRPIGTGPFMFDRWERGSKVLLQRNPNFWEQPYPYLDTVEFQVLTDDTSRLLQFHSGTLDIATNVPFNQIATLQKDPSVVVQIDSIMRNDVIAMNHTRPPFDEKNVRLAINMAIDRAALVKNVLFGHGSIANSALPPMLYWSENIPAYPYDVAQARALLAKSSRPNGFETRLIIGAGVSSWRASATIIQDQLKQIGINVVIDELDAAAAGQMIINGNYDMFMSYLTSDIIDPDELAAIVFAPSGGGNAFGTYYKNDELDTLIRQAARALDPNERARLYEQIQRIYNEDAVVVPLYYPHSRTAVRNYVKGFKILPTANYQLWKVWLDKAGS